MNTLVALAGVEAQTLAVLKSLSRGVWDPYEPPSPHFTLIVIFHLSLFALRNAKHNKVQVQTQTPLPIPVYLTR